MTIKISMQREVKERIREEIIKAAQQFAEEYGIENYTDTASALNCVYAEFKDQFDWKIKRVGEHNAFIEWLRELPMSFVYYYDDERMTIQKWFNQSDEEASKYSDEQVDKLYWNLLAREFFALVKKFNVSGIIKSEDDTKVTPYDMDDYLDNDNALEESTIVSNTGPEDIYEYDQLYEKFNDCVKALFFACNLIHNFSKEYDKESDCCNCICKNCVIYKALDKAGAIKEVSEE